MPTTKATVPLYLRVPESLHEAIKSAANQRGIPMNTLVERLLERFVADKPRQELQTK